MKNIKGSILAKSIAWILLMINLCILAGSIAGAYAMDEWFILKSSYEQKRNDEFPAWEITMAQERFFLVVVDKKTDAELKYYDDMSLKYGIIKAATFDSIDINDPTVYIRRNFNEKLNMDEINTHYIRYDAVDYQIVYYADMEVIEEVNNNLYACFRRIITMDMADGLVWVDACLKLMFAFKRNMFAIMIISFLLIVASFTFLIAAAGHRKKKEEIVPSFLDKIPFDGLIILYIFFWVLFLLFLDENYYLTTNAGGIAVVLITILCSVVAFIFLILSLAVRIKRGGFFKHTLIYILGRKICTFILRIYRRICAFISMVYKNIGILWKAILIMFAIATVEIIVIGCSEPREPGMVLTFWIIEKIIMFSFITYAVVQMKTLQRGSEALAKGDLNRTVETKRMLPEFRKHAENLNRIGEGMAEAVEEKMKSERLKTELITNVSHDIKTPLTSIINYVDLLEKTDIQDENAKEYLDVLKRQSERLKKLIEDLMEASKASTGNLSVNMEHLEAGVVLTQIAGEYEEKLAGNDLKLVLTKPEEPVYMDADGKHLWRVIDNLMNNICKYSQPGSRVYVDLSENGTKVVLTFKNMSKYQLNISSDELMERFVRGDSSRNTEGNGLGLSIAGSLMELMQGSLALKVDGDLFKVTLELNKGYKSI